MGEASKYPVSPTSTVQNVYIRKNSSFGFVHLATKTYFCVMNRLFFCIVFVCSLLLIGCTGSRRQPPEVPRPAPSVYYWRTVLEFSTRERDFLRRHHIGKVYLRYFDVAPDQILSRRRSGLARHPGRPHRVSR